MRHAPFCCAVGNGTACCRTVQWCASGLPVLSEPLFGLVQKHDIVDVGGTENHANDTRKRGSRRHYAHDPWIRQRP